MSLEKTVSKPPDWIPEDKVPLPPPDAKVFPTGCDYCIVGCGYKAYVWPIGKEGGPKANQNAFGVDFPTPALSGYWITPNQHTVVLVDGKPHHAVVIPDVEMTVVNRGGNHSIRGGAIAQKCYSPHKPTRDRLKEPLMRVNGKLIPVSWDTALDVMVGVSRHVLDKHGELGWGMKTYSYQFWENTYAISKICFQSVNTPCYSFHDAPSPGPESAGLSESGFQTFALSYDDLAQSDIIFISGTDPYETKTVLFTEWIYKGGAKLIYALPRKTMGVAYAEKNGGLWLGLFPGTDTILQLAIVRIILEQGWEDKEFIEKWVANDWEIQSGFGRGPRNTPVEWRTTWGRYGTDYEGYKKWILAHKPAELGEASRITGVDQEKIVAAARLLSGGGEVRPKASFVFEKGNYWSNNYLNTASFAALALVCGAGNRSGRVVGRLGGHQRGWASMAAAYPRIKSPEKFPGRRKKEMDLDRWVESGRLKFAWVIGTTWIQSMTASDEFRRKFFELTSKNRHQIRSSDPIEAIENLKARADSGGMVVVDQDIYLRDPIGSEIADVVLPAATWGEEDFTRAQGERRLKIYSKFYDPPGQAKPDWWIIAQFAKKMGFEGFDWKDSNDVFEEGARFSRGGALNYHPLVWHAKKTGKRAHDILKELGPNGIQCPIRYRTQLTEGEEYIAYAGSYRSDGYPGYIVGTKRLHDPETDFGTPEGPTNHFKWLTAFDSHPGKAIFHKSPWEDFSDFFDRVQPKGEELWVINGRINEIWQSAFDDQRRPYILQRWPDNFLEIHTEDAKRRSIESGDYVEIASDDVLVQTGGFVGVEDADLSFKDLDKKGLIRVGKGKFRAVAIVTDAVRPGVAFTNFLWLSEPANSIAPRVPDPITNQYRYKLGKAKVRKAGESPYKKSLEEMSFLPRTIV